MKRYNVELHGGINGPEMTEYEHPEGEYIRADDDEFKALVALAKAGEYYVRRRFYGRVRTEPDDYKLMQELGLLETYTRTVCYQEEDDQLSALAKLPEGI